VVQGYVDAGQILGAQLYAKSKAAVLGDEAGKVQEDILKELAVQNKQKVAGALNVLLQTWMDTHNSKDFSKEALVVIHDETIPGTADAREKLENTMRQDVEAWKRKAAGLPPPPGQLAAWVNFKGRLATDPKQFTTMDADTFRREVLSVIPENRQEEASDRWSAAIHDGGKVKLYEEVVLKACQDANRCPKKSANGVNVNQPSTWPEAQRQTFEKALEVAHAADTEYRASPKNPNKLAAPESEIQKRMTAVFTEGEVPDTMLGWSVNRSKTYAEALAEGKADEWKAPPMPVEKGLEIRKMMAGRTPPIPAWPENVEGFWRMSFTGKAPKIRWEPMSAPAGKYISRPAPEPSAEEKSTPAPRAIRTSPSGLPIGTTAAEMAGQAAGERAQGSADPTSGVPRGATMADLVAREKAAKVKVVP
jgi:hypothetical protein